MYKNKNMIIFKITLYNVKFTIYMTYDIEKGVVIFR